MYLSCSYQEAKIRHDARRLNKFEEHLSGGVFLVVSMAFLRISPVESGFFQVVEPSCIEPIKILEMNQKHGNE